MIIYDRISLLHTAKTASAWGYSPGAVNVGEFYQKSMVDKINRKAWGFADYPKRLDVQTVHQYELRFGGEVEQ